MFQLSTIADLSGVETGLKTITILRILGIIEILTVVTEILAIEVTIILAQVTMKNIIACLVAVTQIRVVQSRLQSSTCKKRKTPLII